MRSMQQQLGVLETISAILAFVLGRGKPSPFLVTSAGITLLDNDNVKKLTTM
jgi:hypothetical protein